LQVLGHNESHYLHYDAQGQKEPLQCEVVERIWSSIALKNRKICLKDGKDIFTSKQEVEEWFITQIPYEQIVIAGKGYVSTDAIQLLIDHIITLT
jgi:CRISPR-associated protein Cas1